MKPDPKASGNSKIIREVIPSVDHLGKTRIHSPRQNSAWTQFYRAYRNLLVGYVVRRWGWRGLDEEDAKDVFQQIVMDFVRVVKLFRYDAVRQLYYEKEIPPAPEPSRATPAAIGTEKRDKRSERFQREFRVRLSALIVPQPAQEEAKDFTDSPLPIDADAAGQTGDGETRPSKRFVGLLFDMANEYARARWRRKMKDGDIEDAAHVPADSAGADAEIQQAEVQAIWDEGMRRLREEARTPVQKRDVAIFEAVAFLRPYRSNRTDPEAEELENGNVREQLMKEHGMTRAAFDAAICRAKARLRAIIKALMSGNLEQL